MAQSRSPAAGGVLLAFGAIAGAAIGFAVAQPTIWLLGGLGAGGLGALLVWWRNR